MDIVELILDEENDEMIGIEAVSIVSQPAIEESFVALSSDEITTPSAPVNNDFRAFKI